MGRQSGRNLSDSDLLLGDDGLCPIHYRLDRNPHFQLFRGSWESIQRFGLGFLVGTTWDPVAEIFGTLPTIVGTIVKSFLSLLIAVPISLGSAIYLALYAPRWIRNPLSYLVEMLAAIPSVVFGLWGLFILVPVVRVMQIWLKAHFGWFPLFQGPAVYGVGILAAGIMLAIMITPIITAISRDCCAPSRAHKWRRCWRLARPDGKPSGKRCCLMHASA